MAFLPDDAPPPKGRKGIYIAAGIVFGGGGVLMLLRHFFGF